MGSSSLDAIQASISQLPYEQRLFLADWIFRELRKETTQLAELSLERGKSVVGCRESETEPSHLNPQVTLTAIASRKPPISDAEHQTILANIYKAWANRPQHLEEMKQRQTKGWEAARIAAKVLKEQFKVKRVVLFGSLLNHEKMHERTDIDLAVWGLPGDQLIKAGVAIDDATYQYNFGPIDLVPFEDAFTHIKESILQDGVEL